MRSIVPLFGKDALEKNEDLKAHLQYIIEEMFGHELKFVDAGSAFIFHRADPTKIIVPFTVAIDGIIKPQTRRDIFGPIQKLYPSSTHIEAPAEELPGILSRRIEELSLGGVGGAPQTIRKSIVWIYNHLSDKKKTVKSMARELGLSKATLDRTFHEWNGKGPDAFRRKVQMLEAKELIVNTGIQIKIISEAVGYTSLDSFDHAFQKFWKCTPTQMRKNYNIKNDLNGFFKV